MAALRQKVMLGGKVTRASRAAWRDWCGAHGVTVTGVLEALGQIFDSDDDIEDSIDVLALIAKARRIDAERLDR